MMPAAAVALAALWFAALISGHVLSPPPGEVPDLVFNAMLTGLLQGRFDIAPEAIGMEGFVHGDRVIAYFGIFPALLRLPLLALPDGLAIDISRASIATAASLSAAWQIRALLLVQAARPLPRSFAVALGAALLFGGPNVQFLRASVYEEVLHWSSAFAAMFVCHAIAGLIGGFNARRLGWMALAAGLAVLTRASTGAGLLVALGGLLAVLAWRGRLRDVAGAGALAAACVAVAMAVNQARWGNPFTVVDLSAHLMNARFPDRLARIATGGEFGLARLPYGLMYYFAPLWPLHWPGGPLLFDAAQQRLLEFELPPASFLLSDPLLVLLALRWRPRTAPAMALTAGLALPGLLMLGLVFMNHRYRQEFYPLLTFAGLAALAVTPARLPATRTAIALAALGIAASHMFLWLYLRAGLGPAALLDVQMLQRKLGL